MPLPLASFAVSAGLGLAKTAIDRIGAGTPSPAQAKAKKTAQDFEAMFLEQSLDRVFSGTGEDGPMGENGTGGGVYRSMLVKEYASTITKSGGLGIAAPIYAELMKLQEGAR
ncbi:MAG TPA: rod-binding protein [Beijerinckiaceae bacterium]|jgi:Rod binding domain-containing protein